MCAGTYVLSLRADNDSAKPDQVFIRHYKIRNTDDGSFYISTRVVFASILKLVEHYKCKFMIFM